MIVVIVAMLAVSPQLLALTLELIRILIPELNTFDPRARPEQKNRDKRKSVESFGVGMERGGGDSERYGATDAERRGRTERRKGVRSGSKNTFRRM